MVNFTMYNSREESIRKECSDRVYRCHEIIFDETELSEELQIVIKKYCQSRSLAFEAVVLNFLTSIASCCEHSSISAHLNFNQPFSLFSVIIGYPSSKKSVLMSFAKESFDEMLNWYNHLEEIPKEEIPTTNNSITIESLLKQLLADPNAMQFWDEFSTLISSMGMYKGGNSGFDRTVYLTLYNGVKKYKHQLKTENISVDFPRVSMLAAGHPSKVIRMLEEEKSQESDGFISRYILVCAKPVRIDLLKSVVYKHPYELTHLLFAVKLLHQEHKVYTFDHESMVLLNDEMKDYDNMCEDFEHKFPIVGYVYGKAHGQLLRLSGIIHVLETVIQILKEFSIDRSTIEFIDIKTAIREYNIPLIIKSDQVKKAIKLVRFFIQTKLRLTGHSGFKSEVPENNMNSIEKKILEMPGEVIFLKHLKHTVKKEHFKEALNILESQGFGKKGSLKNYDQNDKQARSSSDCFIKRVLEPKNEENEDEHLAFTNALLTYKVAITDYIKNCEPRYIFTQDYISDENNFNIVPEIRKGKKRKLI